MQNIIGENCYFNYLNLYETLYRFYQNGVDNIDVTLIISLEKEYYMGENMKHIMEDLKRLMKNKKILLDYNGIKEEFKVNKLQIKVGDVLNRHTFYYRYCVDFFKKYNVDNENLIPLEVKKEFEQRAYEAGKQEGKDWFRDNIEAINLFSNDKILKKDFVIGDDITSVFEETEETPPVCYICYEHWLKHPRYKIIEKALKELCEMENSIIHRCYLHEADYFFERLDVRGETPEYKDLFLQQSYKYLFDETMPPTIRNEKVPNNHFDIYYFGLIPRHLSIYQGKKAKHNETIQRYVKTDLHGIDQCSQISIRKE